MHVHNMSNRAMKLNIRKNFFVYKLPGIAFVWRSTRGCRSRRNAVAPQLAISRKKPAAESSETQRRTSKTFASPHVTSSPATFSPVRAPPSPSRLDTSCTCPELNGVSNGFALVLVRATDYSMPSQVPAANRPTPVQQRMSPSQPQRGCAIKPGVVPSRALPRVQVQSRSLPRKGLCRSGFAQHSANVTARS